MPRSDARIDAYIANIANSADFARPILEHLRAIVHEACPEVEETIKWSFPHFDYKGMMCSMAAFKGHCAFNFWKAGLILDDLSKGEEAMGYFGRITSLRDLPPKKVLIGYVRKAKRLNDEGVPAPHLVKARAKARSTASRPLVVPPELEAALRKDRKARATFDAFAPSHRREYAEWVAEAKREETKAKRVAQAIEMLAEGKTRNWKYER